MQKLRENILPHAKSLALGGSLLVVSGVALRGIRRSSWWAGIMDDGPYPAVGGRLERAVQRLVVDLTRLDVCVQFYPDAHLTNPDTSRNTDNGHPISGGVRDSARRAINATCEANGWEKLELSPASQSPSTYADHQHYAPSDLKRAVEKADRSKVQVVVGIDVDYYIVDPCRYLELGVPTIFFTFQPITVAGKDGDVHFRIKENKIRYEVDGGGVWDHRVWDWAAHGEFVRAPVTIGWKAKVLGLVGVRKYVYHKIAHSRPWKANPHRALVWTLPQFSHYEVSWLRTDMNVRKLTKIVYADPNRPGWNTLVSHRTDGSLMISLGREGEDASMTIPKVDYDILMGLASAQAVTTRMLGMGHKDPSILALFGQYFRGDKLEIIPAARISRPAIAVHWSPAMHVDLPEVEARAYSKPILELPNMVPMIKRWEALSESLEARVTSVKNNQTPPKKYQQYAAEFVRLVVPEPHTGEPYSLEETRDMLDKPTQVAAVSRIWDTLDTPARALIEAFVKNEPCNKEGRIISSFADARFLLGFSAFTLKFRDEVLHDGRNSHWFLPGGTPSRIAAAVCDYATQVPELIEGDYSNFDGTVSSWAQDNIMNAVYHLWFSERYHKELKGYTSKLVSCPARAKRFGFRYDAGAGVKSGSPTTCDLNTILNAYLMYCAVRLSCPDLEKEVAYSQIGLAFGDDSLFDSAYSNNWQRAAKALGMQLKVETCYPTTGVTFLARVFPDPLQTNTSFQDPLRTYRKLHISLRDPKVPLADAACDRVEGYLSTDALSPVTGAYCSAVLRWYLPHASRADIRLRRADRNRETPYWLVTGDSWPQSPDDVEMMYVCASARTGFSITALKELEAQLASAVGPWEHGTLKEEAVETPYRNTLDADGDIITPSVDSRFIDDRQNVVNSRITSKAVRDGAGSPTATNPGPDGPNPRSKYRAKRRGRAKGNGLSRSQEGSEARRKPASEAQSHSTAGRGKGRPRRGGR